MEKTKTKIVSYRDENGTKRQSLIPIDADDSEAELGIHLAFSFPPEWEPHRERIEAALAARGIVTTNDLHKAGVDDLVRQAFQQIIRLDIATLKQLNPRV